MGQLTGPDCVAWVARTVEEYLLTGSEQALDDAQWKLDQVLGAYAHVRDGIAVFGLAIPDAIRAEVATPCEVLIEQAIEDCKHAMVHAFGDAGLDIFYRRARHFGLKLDGDPGPAPVRLRPDTDLRHQTQRLIKRLHDTKAATEYWRAVSYDPWEIPQSLVVGCLVRLPRPDLDHMLAALVDRGVHVPEALVSVYRECNGISVGWVTQGPDGPLLAELTRADELVSPFEDVFGYLDEHSPDEIQIGHRGSRWYFDRARGDVYNDERIYRSPTLLAHVAKLADTYGTFQPLEPTSS